MDEEGVALGFVCGSVAAAQHQRAEQGLTGQEANRGGDVLQQWDPHVGPVLCLDGDAHPDVRGQGGPRGGGPGAQVGAHPAWAFGEDLEDVLVGAGHDVEDAVEVGVVDVGVEQVAGGVHEHAPRTSPPQWLVEAFGSQGHGEPVGVGRGAGEAVRDGLGVAVVAAGADLVAAGDGVPGGIGPGDAAAITHDAPRRSLSTPMPGCAWRSRTRRSRRVR